MIGQEIVNFQHHFETITKIDGRSGRVYALVLKCRACGKERDEGLVEDVIKYGW